MQFIGIVALLSIFSFTTPQDRDTQKIESLYGQVTEVIYLPAANPGARIVEIRIRVAERKLLVRLGPASFLNEYGFAQKEGEDVYVRGYRISKANGAGGADGADGELLIAVEIGKGNRKLTLRSDRGQPIW